MIKVKKVAYTAIIGNYDVLKELGAEQQRDLLLYRALDGAGDISR